MTEILTLQGGILYRGDSRPVTVDHEDVRAAYRDAQRRWADSGGKGWLPDGRYAFDGQTMEVVTDD
jgi:hypothetical protein